MTHRGLRRRLSAYLDGALAPGPRRRAEAHLERCAPCRAELAELRRTLSLLRGQRGAVVAPPDLLPRIARRLAAGEAAPPRNRLLRALPHWRDLQRLWAPLAACAAALALLLALDSVEITVKLPLPAGLAEQPAWPSTAQSGPQQASGAAPPPTAPSAPATTPGSPPTQSIATAPAKPGQQTAQAPQRGGLPTQPFTTAPGARSRGPVRTASAGSQPVARGQGQRQEPGTPPALLHVLRCAGQTRGLGCLRLQGQWVGLALSDPRAFTARLEEIPAPSQARWIADLSRFAVRRGTALQVISRLRGAGDPRAERLAERFEQSAARNTP